MATEDDPTSSPPEAGEPPPKRSLRGRLGDGVRVARARGHEAWVEPGGVFDDARGDFRAWFRKIWKVRGGGLYALGFAVTFLYLEITELVTDDIPTLLSVGSFNFSALIEFAIQFMIDTMMNTVLALIWPALVVGWRAPLGLILLIVAYAVFPKYIKPHIEAWLLHDDDDEQPAQ